MKLKTQAGERLKAVRKMLGMTQKEFAIFVDIPLTRYKGIEIAHTRVAEDLFASACSKLPTFIQFIVYEGTVSLKDLSNSSMPMERLAAANFDVKGISSDSILSEKIIDDRQEN